MSWKESWRDLWELRCILDDVGRCSLSRTSTPSAMLQLRRCCAVYMLDAAGAERTTPSFGRELRGDESTVHPVDCGGLRWTR